MAIARKRRAIHWDYLLTMEDDLVRLARYVDFSGNDQTYSIEIARVLMAAAAEADVVLKELCRRIDPAFRGRTISAYHPAVAAGYSGIMTTQVVIERYGVILRPWKCWTPAAPPLWCANNKVKHERTDRFGDANLKNCLTAVAGLFVVVLYLYRQEAESGELTPATKLLQLPGTMSNSMNGHPGRYYYRLK